jgi:hypothetical protein
MSSNPEFKFIEITVKFVGDSYQETREMYLQRVNFDWMFQNRPMLVQQIAAVVNDLELPSLAYQPPTPLTPGSFTEVK